MTRILDLKTEWKTTAIAESDSTEGAFYRLTYEKGQFSCTCPSHSKAGRECKHIQAFKEELTRQKQMREGNQDEQ
jgi:uncharacterized Zn finger protein